MQLSFVNHDNPRHYSVNIDPTTLPSSAFSFDLSPFHISLLFTLTYAIILDKRHVADLANPATGMREKATSGTAANAA